MTLGGGGLPGAGAADPLTDHVAAGSGGPLLRRQSVVGLRHLQVRQNPHTFFAIQVCTIAHALGTFGVHLGHLSEDPRDLVVYDVSQLICPNSSHVAFLCADL